MAIKTKFEQVRIQLTFPCAAKCKWCRTYLKNPEFARLSKSGDTHDVNEFYISVLKRYRPRVLAISGGEAVLFPDIAKFLKRALEYCDTIRMYTSYQYSVGTLESIDWSGISSERLILTHSCIHFRPAQWHELTNGFPHDRYVQNLLEGRRLPFRKIVKFVINHPDSLEEVKEFLDAVNPDEKYTLSYKLMNEQNNGFGAEVIKETATAVKSLLSESNLTLQKPDPAVLKAVTRDDLMESCQYRLRPVELRFAFWKRQEDAVVMKVRFCPYFGPETSHKFRVGLDPLKKIDKWFESGEYRSKCETCRLLLYDLRAPSENTPSPRG